MDNREICHCMGVTFSDIYSAMTKLSDIDSAESIFNQLQEKTGCGSGCGRCRQEIMLTISDIINGYADPPHQHDHE